MKQKVVQVIEAEQSLKVVVVIQLKEEEEKENTSGQVPPRLLIQVEEGYQDLLKSKESEIIEGQVTDLIGLILNERGLENCASLRKASDGVVYFGAKQDETKQGQMNDFVFHK